MRWIFFALFFVGVLFCSFWTYAWHWRVELIQSTVQTACCPYQVTLKTVEIPSTRTLILSDLSFSHEDKKFHIERAVLQGSWLLWALAPTQAPLHLNSAKLFVSSSATPNFDKPDFPLNLEISTLDVERTDGSSTPHHNLRGPLHTILEEVLRP